LGHGTWHAWRAGGALERLAETDHVVFDKTRTLTEGVPRLIDNGVDLDRLAIAAALASRSRHPYSQAIAAAGRLRNAPAVSLDQPQASITARP